jgi:hypothetical protein
MMTTVTSNHLRADCSPEARVTRSLLGYGMVAGPFYVLASVAEGLLRPDFDFTRHDWSLLALGAFGWVHVVVLVLTGLMVGAAGVGLARALGQLRRSRTPGWFLLIYGAGLIGAGAFTADPVPGFPADTPDTPTSQISVHGLLHIAFGGVGFVGLVVACLITARQFQREDARAWAWFSLATGVLFLASFVGIAAGGAPGTATVLLFTAGVVLSWTWLLLVSRRLFVRLGPIPDDER